MEGLNAFDFVDELGFSPRIDSGHGGCVMDGDVANVIHCHYFVPDGACGVDGGCAPV